jgi:hypothetical protein
MLSDLDHFYLNQDEPNRSCMLAMRSMVIAQSKHVTETVKYGMPCFSYKQKVFCYLWIDKKTHEPYLLMVEGKHLDHPLLEAGKRSRMKIFRVDPRKDLPFITIDTILQQALNLYKNGVVKIKD